MMRRGWAICGFLCLFSCSGGSGFGSGTPFMPTLSGTTAMTTTADQGTTGEASTSTSTSSGSAGLTDGATGSSSSTSGSSGEGSTSSISESASASASASVGSSGGPDPVCGNGLIEDGEECDDGNNADNDACRNACVAAKCGDGVVQMGAEACDDANMVDNDACSNACKAGACGDGVVQMSEGCDDANNVNEDACLNTCLKAKCGDSVVHMGVEQCDGGGETAQCDTDCTTAMCGDGKINATLGEQCDAGNETPLCDGDCTMALCGDGKINAMAGEECDDANMSSNDGCSSGCKKEAMAQKCQQGSDPGTGAPWVVCEAGPNQAWVAANSSGQFHPVLICQNLGYTTVGQYGGTCGSVCGYCQGGTDCNNTGNKIFDLGNWNGSGNCGGDGLGPIICQTVHWTCIK